MILANNNQTLSTGSYTYLLVSIGFDEGDRLFGLAADLAREHFDFDPGTDVVLAAVDDPGDCRNDEDDCKSSDTVVWGGQ